MSRKTCSRCEITKNETDFGKNMGVCKTCIQIKKNQNKIEKQAEKQAENTLEKQAEKQVEKQVEKIEEKSIRSPSKEIAFEKNKKNATKLFKKFIDNTTYDNYEKDTLKFISSLVNILNE